MTLVQMPRRPADPASATPASVDATGAAGLRVGDDMTVEVALSVMASGPSTSPLTMSSVGAGHAMRYRQRSARPVAAVEHGRDLGVIALSH